MVQWTDLANIMNPWSFCTTYFSVFLQLFPFEHWNRQLQQEGPARFLLQTFWYWNDPLMMVCLSLFACVSAWRGGTQTCVSLCLALAFRSSPLPFLVFYIQHIYKTIEVSPVPVLLHFLTYICSLSLSLSLDEGTYQMWHLSCRGYLSLSCEIVNSSTKNQ